LIPLLASILNVKDNEITVISLTLREEHRLRVLGSRVLKRIFEPKRTRIGGNCRSMSFMLCIYKQILFG
jgi:hypothetical protein